MKKIICLLIILSILILPLANDSIDIVRSDSLAALLTQKEIEKEFASNLADLKVRIKNIKTLITYSKNRISDIESKYGKYDCNCTEYMLSKMTEIIKELNASLVELVKSEKILNEKINASDKKIKKLLTEFDDPNQELKRK